MPAPSVPYEIVTRPPPQIRDTDNGPEVAVTAIIKWADAFTFYNDVKGSRSQPIGIGDLNLGFLNWRYPGDSRLLCTKCDITPFSIPESETPTAGDNKGIVPGEFFLDARANLLFALPKFDSSDEQPSEQLQFDPENPITFCTCDMDFESETAQYETGTLVWYDNQTETVPFKASKKTNLIKLVLTFPKIPFLPFRTLTPFVDTVNKYRVLGCEPGTLLFNGAATKANYTNLGIRDKSCKLSFTWRRIPWAYRYKRNGTLGRPVLKSDTSKFLVDETDHRLIFRIPSF